MFGFHSSSSIVVLPEVAVMSVPVQLHLLRAASTPPSSDSTHEKRGKLKLPATEARPTTTLLEATWPRRRTATAVVDAWHMIPRCCCMSCCVGSANYYCCIRVYTSISIYGLLALYGTRARTGTTCCHL